MKVWVDLANSPHPLLFEPLARRLEERGASIAVTVRDSAQTLQLARERWPDAAVIGGPTPAGRTRKVAVMAARVRELARWARSARPDVALSHNSYGQLLAARTLGVRAVTAMDYEFQPANHVAFRCATRILLPEAIPSRAVRRQGAAPSKVSRYPGVKEELYAGEFEPDPGVLARLGLDRRNAARIIVARTPPLRATYHGSENRLFVDCLRMVGRLSDVRCVVLARHPEDRRQVDSLQLENCIVPEEAVDARSLMREADLVLGAGGTMTREAAVMGIPTYSVFRGARPAVDMFLKERGALRFLESPRELERVPARPAPPTDLDELRACGGRLQETFARTVLDLSVKRGGGAA